MDGKALNVINNAKAGAQQQQPPAQLTPAQMLIQKKNYFIKQMVNGTGRIAPYTNPDTNRTALYFHVSLTNKPIGAYLNAGDVGADLIQSAKTRSLEGDQNIWNGFTLTISGKKYNATLIKSDKDNNRATFVVQELVSATGTLAGETGDVVFAKRSAPAIQADDNQQTPPDEFAGFNSRLVS